MDTTFRLIIFVVDVYFVENNANRIVALPSLGYILFFIAISLETLNNSV